MNKLIIVRHAKSSWDNPELDDFDRPLNNRGKKDAPEMGRRLAQRHVMPDMMITSPAKRAASTAKRIATEISFPKKSIKKESDFYEASIQDFISVLKKVGENVKTLMIFSHNPGLTDLANYLADAGIYNIPTSGVVEIAFENIPWSGIGKHTGKLLSFDYPKKIETSD